MLVNRGIGGTSSGLFAACSERMVAPVRGPRPPPPRTQRLPRSLTAASCCLLDVPTDTPPI